MEFHRLQYFVTVAEDASFTRAAERLHVAQPGVSSQIRKLEESLGQPVFDRSGRTVRITDFGAELLPLARAALATAAEIEALASEYTGAMRGHVSIGTVTSHPVDVAALLGAFHEDHPAVTISLVEGTVDELLAGLRSGRLDAAITAFTWDQAPDLETRIVIDDALVAVRAGKARGARVPLRDLRSETLITLPPGSGIRAILDRGCTIAGFSPTIGFEASDPALLVQLAAAGLGTAIVPASLSAVRRHDLPAAEITEPALRGRLGWAWLTGGPSSPAGKALVARIMD